MPSSTSRRSFCQASAFALACAVGVPLPAAAQSAVGNYPQRLVHMIVPFPAGGTADAIFRFIAQRMGQALGQPMVVDNIAGAAGVIGLAQGLKAAPDGYTISQISNTNTVAAMHMFKKLPFDPLKDMVPIGSLYEIPSALIAGTKDAKFKTFAEFLAYAKANPGKLSYAYSHATGAVTGASIKQAAGIDMLAIPYKSGPQAAIETIAGEVPLLATDVGAVLPFVRSGQMKALAVTSARRTPLLPDVPTLREVLPNPMEFVGWGGLVVPVGTPRPIVEKLNATLNKILASDECTAFLRGLGAEPMAMSPADFGRFIRDQEPLWGKALAVAGVQPE